jgi:hypothetical protein
MTLHVRAPVDGSTLVVPILRAGVVAMEFCKALARAEVAAAFERSFYLRAGDLFVCVGEPAIGNGPLTLIAPMRVAEIGLRPGQPAVISASGIAIGAVTLTYDRCESWHPPRWRQTACPSLLAQIRDAVVRRAAAEAPAEGFGRAVAESNAPSTAFARVARKRLAHLQSWLADTIKARGAPAASLPAPVRELVGLGPGLTPSGDDVLIGALAFLDALAERHAHASLAHALRHIPAGLTSPLSHCFLRTAAAGHVGEHLHAAVSSLVSGDADAAVAAVRTIGHCSGWDMMAGAVTALAAALAARSRLTPLCAASNRNR